MNHDTTGYSNKSENLPSLKLQSAAKLKIQIFRKPTVKIPLNQYSLPLKTPYSAAQLKLPLRNSGCYTNPLCLYNLEQMLVYLSVNMKADDKGVACYHCLNCKKNFENNRRYVSGLYLERHLALVIQLAKIQYSKLVPDDTTYRNFKKGLLKFSKTGQVIYNFQTKIKINGAFQQNNYNLKLKEQDTKLQKSTNIVFDRNDEIANIDSLSMFSNYLTNSLSIKISSMSNMLRVATGVSYEEKIQKQAAENIKMTMKKNINLVDSSLEMAKKSFTFAFKNQIHVKPLDQDFSLLTLFYPQMKLWRKYFLEYSNNDPFMHPEGALYLKYEKKIVIIGGSILRYVNTNMNSKIKKLNPNLDTIIIDLSKLDPLRPTRFLETQIQKKPIKIKSSINKSTIQMANSGTIQKVQSLKQKIKHKVIDLLAVESLKIDKKASLPEPMSLSAGVIFNNCAYIFGGCKTIPEKDKDKEVIIGSSYCLNLETNKWTKLKDLPSPRKNHCAFVHNNMIYILGGVQANQNDQTIPTSTRKVQIYNPANNTYISKNLADNPYLNPGRAELFNYRCIPIKVSPNQYIFINGQKNVPFQLNPQNLEFSIGKSQMVINHTAVNWGGNTNPDYGVKLQQVFDSSPCLYNGNYYYAHYSVSEDKSRVIYGDYQGWSISEELDPANWTKQL